MKKKVLIFTSVILAIVLLVACFAVYKLTEFDRLRIQRESVCDMIKNGEISVEANGLFALPENLKKLSDSGECFIVEFEGNTAIYFYTFRGLLESSRGYLYVTENLSYEDYVDTSKYSPSHYFVNVVEIDDNWYSCSTD